MADPVGKAVTELRSHRRRESLAASAREPEV